MNSLVVWLNANQGMAAWAQGIGALLAIVVAFIVAGMESYTTKRINDEDRRRRAHALSLILLPDVTSLRHQLASPDVSALNRRVVPTGITERLDQLYILEEAGSHLLRAIAAIDEDFRDRDENQTENWQDRPLRKTATSECDAALDAMYRKFISRI